MNCNKCKLNKLENDFVFKSKIKGIRHTICKVCQREYKKKYYEKNKDSHYLRNKANKHKLIEIVKKEKEKGCLVCHEKCNVCLDFHHLGDKKDNVSQLVNRGNLKRLMIEIDKCIVLCSNCHRKFHAGLIHIKQ